MAGDQTAIDSRQLSTMIGNGSLADASVSLSGQCAGSLVGTLSELPATEQAVAFRLLAKDTAMDVFECLDAGLQKPLVRALHDEEVTEVFSALDPDDRARLVEELPAKVAKRLIADLSPHERTRTAVVLGYPADSVGRFVHEQTVAVHPGDTAAQVIAQLHERAGDATDFETMAVIDAQRTVVGLLHPRAVFAAGPGTPVAELSAPPLGAEVTQLATGRPAISCGIG